MLQEDTESINGRMSENKKTKKKHKRSNNDPQNTTQRTPLKTRGELRYSGMVSSFSSTSYKPGDRSWTRKEPGSVYDKWSQYPWLFATQRTVTQNHSGDLKNIRSVDVKLTTRNPWFSRFFLRSHYKYISTKEEKNQFVQVVWIYIKNYAKKH